MSSTYGPITVQGTTTSFLPMTTAFSAPPACSSLFLTDNAPGFTGVALRLFAYDAKYASVAGGGPTCLPSEVSLWWSQGSSSQTTAITQLGGYTMSCPQQYTTQYSYASNTETTTIGCCPSSYTFSQFLPFGSPVQYYSVIPAGEITYLQPQPNSASIWTTTSSSFASPYTILAVQVNGYIVPNPGSTSSTSSISSNSSTGSTKTPGSSSGLSSGAKAGIGVAVAVGVIGILALFGAWTLFRRRQQTQYQEPTRETAYYGRLEMDARQERPVPPATELQSPPPTTELQGPPPATELQSPPPALELDARPQLYQLG